MAKSKTQKAELLKTYKEMLANSDGFLAVTTDKLDNITTVQLKKDLAQSGSKFVVVKNTLFKIALQETNINPKILSFDGATAIITYTKDPTIPAKTVNKIFEEKELLEPKFGYVESQILDKEGIIQLAQIPSREELLGQLIGSIISPVRGFMTTVTGNIRGLTQIFSQLKK